MLRRLVQFVVVIPLVSVSALVVLGLFGVARTTAGDPCYHGFAIPARTDAAETKIKVAPCAFAPTVARVAVGATVTFFNGPDFVHLITGADGEWGSRDAELQPGQTVSYRFDRPGIYPYACALHRGMSGTIAVGDIGTAVGAETVNDGSTGRTSEPSKAAGSEPGVGTIAGGALAGVVVGAGGLWVVMRRRQPGVETVPRDS